MKKITIFRSPPRCGKTREMIKRFLVDKVMKDDWVEQLESGTINFYMVNMIGDSENDSTASSTIHSIKEMSADAKITILTSRLKICNKLIVKRFSEGFSEQCVKMICKSCHLVKKLGMKDISRVINRSRIDVYSFKELIQLSKEREYCPEAFALAYSQFTDMNIISKAKTEVLLEISDVFSNYNLIIDEAHGLLNFNEKPQILIRECITYNRQKSKVLKIDEISIRESIKDFFNFKELLKIINGLTILKKYTNGKNFQYILEDEIERIVKTIVMSLNDINYREPDKKYIIKQNSDFQFVVGLFEELVTRSTSKIKVKIKLLEFLNDIYRLNNINTSYLVTDISGSKNDSITVRFYEVGFKNNKIVITNTLRDKLFNNARDIYLVTSTPPPNMFYNMWLGDNGFNIKYLNKRFTGKFYIFYSSLGFRLGVNKTYENQYLLRNQKIMKSVIDCFEDTNNLYVVARNIREEGLMEKYFGKIRSKPCDDYIGSITSEGVQRNEKLSVLFGVGYIPVNDFMQSSKLFKTTIGMNISSEEVRIAYINMLSMQRTIQAMFRNADVRDKRGCLMINLDRNELALLKAYSIGRDKNIIFQEIPKDVQPSNYGEYIEGFLL